MYCFEFQITLGQTMKALIVLRGLIIEHVSAMALSEDVEDDNGKVSTLIMKNIVFISN